MEAKKVRGKNRRYNPYKRVRVEGGSAVVTLGALIPLDWKIVKVEEMERPSEDERIIRIKKVS